MILLKDIWVIPRAQFFQCLPSSLSLHSFLWWKQVSKILNIVRFFEKYNWRSANNMLSKYFKQEMKHCFSGKHWVKLRYWISVKSVSATTRSFPKIRNLFSFQDLNCTAMFTVSWNMWKMTSSSYKDYKIKL